MSRSSGLGGDDEGPKLTEAMMRRPSAAAARRQAKMQPQSPVRTSSSTPSPHRRRLAQQREDREAKRRRDAAEEAAAAKVRGEAAATRAAAAADADNAYVRMVAAVASRDVWTAEVHRAQTAAAKAREPVAYAIPALYIPPERRAPADAPYVPPPEFPVRLAQSPPPSPSDSD